MSVASERLESVAQVVRGVSFDKAEVSAEAIAEMIPILRAGNIADVLDTGSDLIWVPSARVKQEQLLRSGDIAICMSSGSQSVVGKSALLRREWTGSVGAFCAIVRPRPERVEPAYLALYMRSEKFRTWTRKSEGANIKNIRHSELLQHSVPVPPLAEQRHIVDLLSRAENIVRMRQAAEARAKEIAPALFSNVLPTRVGSPTVPLVSLVEQSRGITYGVVQRGKDTPGGVPLLRIGDFVGNEWAPKNVVRIEAVLSQRYSRTILQGGEIVVSIRGTIGRSSIVPAVAQGWNVAREVAVVPLRPGISREFVHAFLQSPEAQQFFSRETRGVAQRGINLEDLRTLAVPTPSSDDVREYEAHMARMRSAAAMQARATSVARLTFDSLLAGVFEE